VPGPKALPVPRCPIVSSRKAVRANLSVRLFLLKMILIRNRVCLVATRRMNELKRNERGRIIRFDPDHPLSQRMMMMGLHEGMEVRILDEAPFGGPMALEAGYFRMAVRRADAAGIWLEVAA